METIAFSYTLDLRLTEQLLDHWLPAYEFRKSDTKRIHRKVQQVAATLGIWDEKAELPVFSSTREYQYEVIRQAFDGAARQHLSNTRMEISPFYLATEGISDGLYKATIVLRKNINRVNKEEAIALPGLGKKSARKLLVARQLERAFHDWESVKNAAGISNDALDRLKAKTYIGQEVANEVQASAYKAITVGGVETLVAFLLEGEVVWEDIELLEEPHEMVLEVINRLSDHIIATPHRPRFWKPSMKRLSRGSQYLQRDDTIIKNMSTVIDGVGYVRGSQYLYLVLHFINNAKISISLSMFFFHLAENGPGKEMFELLKAVKSRGIEVKLILDNDLEGDYHNARNVNAKVFEALKAAGITFNTSYPDRTNHSKQLIVDRKYVLAGSHNWTTSSIYQYEETSFLVQSEELGEKAAKKFDRLFEMQSEDGRIIYLVELDYLSEQEKKALSSIGMETYTQIKSSIETETGRSDLSVQCNIDTEKLTLLYHLLRWMETAKISETTAITLSFNGLESLEKVQLAAEEEVTEALGQLADLPEPFNYRAIPPGISSYLKTL